MPCTHNEAASSFFSRSSCSSQLGVLLFIISMYNRACAALVAVKMVRSGAASGSGGGDGSYASTTSGPSSHFAAAICATTNATTATTAATTPTATTTTTTGKQLGQNNYSKQQFEVYIHAPACCFAFPTSPIDINNHVHITHACVRSLSTNDDSHNKSLACPSDLSR